MKNIILKKLSSLEVPSIHLVRIAIFIVMAWIGALKFAPYEAESIVPMIANSPFMSFVYVHPAPEYKQYMSKEGEIVAKNQVWHESNRTYVFSDILGTAIISIGVLMLIGVFSPTIGLLGSFLVIGMSFTTLSFLVTTPEAWVSLGNFTGFPYLSGMGRLIIKDLIMLAGAILSLSDSARRLLAKSSL